MPFSPLSLVNALSFKSPHSRRLARDVAYGPAPRQRLDVYGPRDIFKPLGVIVFIYGGSWAEGDRRDYSFVGRFLAGLGYLVFVPDYRILPEIQYPVFIDDTAFAIQWAIANATRYGGDPTRVALMGHSAGAYNAIMAALEPRYGLTKRLRAVVGLSGPYDFYPFDVDITKRTFGHVPDPKLTQPVNRVTPDAPPMFLATGDSDKLVYPRNTVALAKALSAAGVTVDEKHYPGGHPTLLLALGSVLGGGGKTFRNDVLAYLRKRLAR